MINQPIPPKEEEVLRTWDCPPIRFLCPICNRALKGVEKECRYCHQKIDWERRCVEDGR